MNRDQLRITPQLVVWVPGFVAVALIGGSLIMDLSGQSAADLFVIERWSFEGLRIYLWVEAFLLAAIVAGLGAHVVTTGLAVTRGVSARMFGILLKIHPIIPRQLGYVLVLLGASLVALSITTLALLNSCRYMRLM